MAVGRLEGERGERQESSHARAFSELHFASPFEDRRRGETRRVA